MNDVIAARGVGITRLPELSPPQPRVLKALVCLTATAYSWWTQVDQYATRNRRVPSAGFDQIDRVIQLLRADTVRMRTQLTAPGVVPLPARSVDRRGAR
jgi:hypothetical protein